MCRYWLLALLLPASLAADPATLHVNLVNGRFLYFRLQSHYKSPVTRFEVAADFGEHYELGCGLTVEVKRPQDLRPPGNCGLPVDPQTQKLVPIKWRTRIVAVEFADGTRWTPRH